MAAAPFLLLFHKCRPLTEPRSLIVTTITKPSLVSQRLDKYAEKTSLWC